MLKIKKIEIFFQNIGMNGLSYGKISKMPKKKFWENGGILCFGDS